MKTSFFLSTSLLAVFLTSSSSWTTVRAFGTLSSSRPTTFQRRSATRIFLKDSMAALIDSELDREEHQDDFAREWMEKNVIHLKNEQSAAVPDDEDSVRDMRQKARDRSMAKKNPQQYCADRCIATGNCDVYEDMFHFSPQEVVKFCSDCVLGGEEEDTCDIPDAFYDMDGLMP